MHSRAAEAQGTMSERTQVMLELVLDIKNNRKLKGSAQVAALESLLSQGSLRFLRESKVPEIQLHGLTWEKLMQPQKKVTCPFFCATVTCPSWAFALTVSSYCRACGGCRALRR